MSKLLTACMAGFLCGLNYRQMCRHMNWKKMKRRAQWMLKKI